MPKTRKNEAEVTPAAMAPVSARRRAVSAGAAPRKSTPRNRAPQAAAAVESPVLVETSVAAETIAKPTMEAVAETVVIETVVSEPTHAQISALAYSYFVNRGYQGGSPEQDWLRAERELRQAV